MLGIAKLLVIISSVGILFFLLYPRKMVGVYFFIRPLAQPAANLGVSLMGLPVTSLYSCVIIFSAVFNAIRKGPKTIFVKHSIFLYLLLLFSSLSFINSANYVMSLAEVVKIMTSLSFFLLIYTNVKTSNDGLLIVKAISCSSILPLLFGFYQYATGIVYRSGRVGLEMTDRINSFMGQPNEYGIYLTLVLVATLIVIFHEKNKKYRFFFICICAMILLSEILAKNRGTWIALLAGFFVSSVFFRKMIKIRWVMAVLLVIAVFFSNAIYNRFQQLNEINTAGRVTNTFAGRVNHWIELGPIIMDHAFIGNGIGTSRLVTFKKLGTELAPHNDYLRMAVDIGIPGAFLYFLFLMYELVRNLKLGFKKKYWQVNYPVLTLAAYFVIISTTQNIITNLINFPLFVSLIAISMRLNEIFYSEQSGLAISRADENGNL